MPRPIATTAVPVVSAAEAIAAKALVIDLRTPAEYAADHLPGAVNVPLFDDQERAVIGTLYKRASPDAAFDEARRRARARIRELCGAIGEAAGWELPPADLEARLEAMTAEGIARLEGELAPTRADGAAAACAGGRPVVLHCWRGGLRSRSVVAFLRGLGLERAVGLRGGYKSYRALVRSTIDGWSPPPTWVLRGLTGVGKTLVLRALERERPGWTLDYEALAGHRSSILGMVGLEPCSQKAFDSCLAAWIRARPRELCVVEGESRKVGDVVLPATAWAALDAGENLLLEAPVERRIEVLRADYLRAPTARAELRRQLPFLEERLGRARWKGRLVALLDAGREDELVEALLERYYDPLYRRSETGRSYAARIDATDPTRAAREVAAWIDAARPT